MKMQAFALQMLVICVFLQMPGCFPSCIIKGLVANCASQNLRWVPTLPPNLTNLYLEMNHIAEINASSLAGLEDLQELDLGHQFTRLVIRDNAFSRQTKLKKLVLGFNIKLQLELQAFVGLSSLQSLDLDYCSLGESILKENYLQPLSSLETLDLFGNQIKSLQPAMFFSNITNLKYINLKLNKIDKICEPDLAGFWGKHLQFLNLDTIHLPAMSNDNFDWQKCGNPFRQMSFQTLDLSYNGFSAAKSERFFRAIQGTKISHLKMSGPMGKGFSFHNIPDPNRSTFEGLQNSSIHILNLSKNRIYALQHGVFSPLREVEIIDVSQNRVNQIQRNAFEGLQGHLRLLNLSHNLLGEIYSYHFSSLTNLNVLDLSYNHIGALGYSTFLGLSRLRALYLTGNSLRELGFPAPLLSLDYLWLDDNKLKSSSVSSITRLAPNVKHLDVRANRLTDLGDVYTFVAQLKNVQNLFYGGNTIKLCRPSRRVSQMAGNRLKVLDLHSSNLQSIWSQRRCLDLFDTLGHSAGLNLSSNALQSLPQGVFKGLTSMLEMDLSSNMLTYVQPDALPNSLKKLSLANNFIASPDPAAFGSLRYLDLEMNRFHCYPNLRSFLTWLTHTNVTFLSRVEELRCEFPADFYKVPLLDYSAQATQQ